MSSWHLRHLSIALPLWLTLAGCGGDGTSDPAGGAAGAGGSADGGGGDAATELDGSGAGGAGGAAGASGSAGASGHAGAAGAACDQGYGMPCMTASNTYCQVNGSLDCYGISLKNVCGPPGRSCTTTSATCADPSQTCYGPLIAGDVGDNDGICLTEDEMRCFCAAIGLMLRPAFCPVDDSERPGLGEYCNCADFCPYDAANPLCQAELTCARHQCVGPVCSSSGPDTCPDGMMCTTFVGYNGEVLGEACRPE